LTGTKHTAFSANHWTDIDRTKHNYNQEQQKNLNNYVRKLLTNAQTEPNKQTTYRTAG